MAKIGVVTFSNTKDNYGQVLQYLATQEYFKERGHDSFLLSNLQHKRTLSWLLERILWRIYMLKAPKSTHFVDEHFAEKKKLFDKWHKSTDEVEMCHPRKFDVFRNKFFKIITGYYEDLKKIGVDVLAVGSDQTWSYYNEYYFLGFRYKARHRIAISPSMGHARPDSRSKYMVRRWLKNFSFVTVRESSGLKLCADCGYNGALQALDPTFLISENVYLNYSSKLSNSPKKPYLFLYLLGAPIDENVEDIYNFAANHGLDVIYVASQGREDDKEKVYATVEEWLQLISGASYVATNSFHGTALSIIFHKPFVVFPIVGVLSTMNKRLFEMADRLQLQNRIIKNNLDLLFEEIDWSFVDRGIMNNKKVMNSLMEKIGL